MKLWRSFVATVCAVAILLGMLPAVVTADPVAASAPSVDVEAETLDVSALTAEDILGEDETRREANVKHFKLSDGSMAAVSYPIAVHEEVDGQWEEIDHSLTTAVDEDGDSVQVTSSQNVRFSFVNGRGNRRLVKAEDTRSNARILFELEDADKKELLLAEDADSEELFAVTKAVQKGTYRELLPDTDVEYIFAGTTLKENVIVKKPEAVRPLRFILHCKNVTAELQEDQSVLFTAEDGAEVFSIPAPFMVDAAHAVSEAVTVTLEEHPQGYVYTMTPSVAWTSDPARVYPVVIDPIVESALDTDALRAVFVKESQPDSNFGGESLMWVGNVTSTAQCYGLVRAELPTLSAADYVTGVYYYTVPSPTIPAYEALLGWSAWNAQYLDGSMVMTAHAVTADWTEGGVTWNNCPAFDTSVLDAVTLTAAHKPSYTAQSNGKLALQTEPILLNITEIGKAWYNGAENHGVLLKLNNEGAHTFATEFFSDQGEWVVSTQKVHPHAIVRYRSKEGLEDRFSYASVSAQAAGTGYVQLHSGNLTFVQDGFTLGGTVAPVAIKHVYNACNSDRDLGYGYGWTLNYAQTLEHVTIGENTYVAYTDADATVHYFDVTDAADEYEDEERLGFTLNGAKNEISDKNDTVWTFDTRGRLTSIKEAHGEKVTITYTADDMIASLNDGLGRMYDFTYENGHLRSIDTPDGRLASYGYTNDCLTSVSVRRENATVNNLQYRYNGHLLTEAIDHSGAADDGTKTVGLISYRGGGTGARVSELRCREYTDNAPHSRAYTTVAYDLHHTTVTDQDGLAVTYQFDEYGLTRSVYNDHGHAQYFKYYAPNVQNADGTKTYGVGKLEAASQTHYVVGNVLQNHGFENSGQWSSASGGTVDYSVVEPYEGNKKLVLNSLASSPKIVVQSLPQGTLRSGGQYTLSAYINHPAAVGGETTLCVDTGDGGTVLASTSVKKTQGWQRVQCTFTAPASSVRVVLKKTGNANAFADAVQLERGAVANRYNLLENSDLSRLQTNGTRPLAWTFETDGGVGANASDGALEALGLDAGHFRTAVSTADPTRVFFDSTLSQTVALGSRKTGSTLSYGGWARLDPLPRSVDANTEDVSRCGIRIELFNGATSVQTAFVEANRYCEEWQFLGDVIVAKQPFTHAKVSFVYEHNVNEAHFDGAFLYADYFGQSYRYDDEGNVISTTAYADQKSTFEYTASDDLQTVVSPAGAAYTYTYNDFHDVKTGTSAEDVTYAYRYDENEDSDTFGQVLSAQTVLGTARNDATVKYTFDDDKLLTSQQTADVRGNAVTQHYRADGLLLKTVDATGLVTDYTYDARDRVTAVEASKDGRPLSTVSYVYDTADRLKEIRNGEVCYVFTYDAAGRVVNVAVGTAAGNAVTLSSTSYVDKTASNGYYSAQVAAQTYGNGDCVRYTYDDFGRVVGVRYEGDTADRFRYTYDSEGCLAAVADTVSGVTVRYEYDLSKRLSRILQSDGYTLTYEYNVENALVGVTESFDGVEKTTRYVYNKDSQITRATSPTGSAVSYDYSYDRRVNRYTDESFSDNKETYGFGEVTGATLTVLQNEASPVADAPTLQIERTATAKDITNKNAVHLRSLLSGHRYVLSYWYCAQAGTSGSLEATLTVTRPNADAQDTVKTPLSADGEWHYVECLLTAKGDLYSQELGYISPTLTWTGENAAGTLKLNGIHFSEEYDTVVFPKNLSLTTMAPYATSTAPTDADAPNPAFVREWTKTGQGYQWIGCLNRAMATTAPQPGEVWELTCHAKYVSGTIDTGLVLEFRDGNDTATAVSTRGTITLDTDDSDWHTYKTYVTVADDAYANCTELLPYVGWLGSETAGAIRISGITVRKVGNQWNNAMPYLGFSPPPSSNATTELKEVDSTDSPIAYQKTIRAAHNGTAYQYQFSAPLSTFPQPTATDRWTLSFWAKTDGNNTVKLYKRTSNSGAPQSTALIKDDRWHYYAIPLALGSGFDLSDIALYYSVEPQTEVHLNGISLVPGDTPLATESYQNSAALKNKTVDTGTVRFNTAIEYDTDADRTAYSRIKHFINQGEAISYSYDTAGNISSIQNPDGSYVTYTYDALNQLTEEHYSLPQSESAYQAPSVRELSSDSETEGVSYNTVAYEYDPRGNLTEKIYSLNGETVDTVNYGYTDTVWKDRLTSFDGNNIAYDTIGNPLNWHDGATLSWQRGRQLASYTKVGTSITYTYNADGIRTAKTVNGVTTSYTVTDGTLRRMTSGDNTLEFINGTSVIFNNTEYWYVFNAQNDVIGIIDANGEYVVEYTYDAWGTPLSKAGSLADTLGTLNPFRYRGYIYDEETGFYYVSSRYYDPVVGRFLNADNEALVTATPEVPHWDKNLYAYCDNNPTIRIDADGEFWHLFIGTVVGAVAGAVGKMASNLLTGEDLMSGVGTAALGGAASGLLASTGVGLVGSIAGNAAISATCNVTTQVIENNGFDNFDVTSLVVDTAIGGVAGAIGGKGFGSNHLNSAGKQLTSRTVNAVTHSSSKAAVNEIKKAGVNYVKNTATLITQGVAGGIIKPTVSTVFMSTAFSYGVDAYRYVYGR